MKLARTSSLTSLDPGRTRLHDVFAALVLISVGLSVVLFVVAARAYPGGTHFDHLHVGHDFWRNTICDVARSTALGGAPNDYGAALARTAMTTLGIAVGGSFWLLPNRFPSRPRLGVTARMLGILVVPGMLSIAMLPTDRFSGLHGVAIVVAGVPALAAASIATIALALEGPRHRVVSLLGIAAMLVAASDFGLYVHELIVGGPPRVSVSVLERLTTLLVLAWIVAIASGPWLNRSGAPTPESEARRQSPDSKAAPFGS